MDSLAERCAVLLQMRLNVRALRAERERIAQRHGDNGTQLREIDTRIETLDEAIGQRAREAEQAAGARAGRRSFRDFTVVKHG